MPALLSFNEDALVYTILAAFQAPPPTKNGGETQSGIAISSGTKIIQRQSHTHIYKSTLFEKLPTFTNAALFFLHTTPIAVARQLLQFHEICIPPLLSNH